MFPYRVGYPNIEINLVETVSEFRPATLLGFEKYGKGGVINAIPTPYSPEYKIRWVVRRSYYSHLAFSDRSRKPNSMRSVRYRAFVHWSSVFLGVRQSRDCGCYDHAVSLVSGITCLASELGQRPDPERFQPR